MTQEQIKELKRLAEAATPGPWSCYAGVLRGCNNSGTPIAATYRAFNSQYIAAANPAAILELIAEMERLREDADDLTIALESSEKALKDSRANDYTAMGYLADCRVAVGDNGKRMLPEFVEYLRQLKQQRDELLAVLKSAKRAIGDHYAPHDCYATGPLTGDAFLDLVQCPACAFLELHAAVVAKAEAQS